MIINPTKAVALTTSYAKIATIPTGVTSVALWLGETDKAETISAFIYSIDGVKNPQTEGEALQSGQAWTPFWPDRNTSPTTKEIVIYAKCTASVTAYLDIVNQ